MPVTVFPHPEIPVVGEPAKVTGLAILVTIVCNQCDAGTSLILVGEQQVACSACGAVYGLDAVRWDRREPHPHITFNVMLRAARPLVS